MPESSNVKQAISRAEGRLTALTPGVPQFSPWFDLWTANVSESMGLIPFATEGSCYVFTGNNIRLDARFDANYANPTAFQIVYDTAELIAGVFTILPTGLQQALIAPTTGAVHTFICPTINHRFVRFRFLAVNAVIGQINYAALGRSI